MMLKYFSILFFLFCVVAIAQPEFSEMAVKPGAFSRMGFGPRGIGFGNAFSSITEGELVSYYNPAITPFQQNNSVQSGYTILSLDRSLNFLSYTRKFDFYSTSDTTVNKKPKTTAGLSVGIVNSGVSDIDGRDNNGISTGDLSTSENQFFMGLAARISEKVSIGLSIKFYYYKLYEEITSNSLGFDIGALYRLNDNFNFSMVISDINSKYKWDTAPVYEQNGVTTEDKFPTLWKFGVSYRHPGIGLLGAIEFENSNSQTNIFRAGVEYNIYDQFYIRGGIDQINIDNLDWPVVPSVGFSFFKDFNTLVVGVEYAYQYEQYTGGRNIVGLNFNF